MTTDVRGARHDVKGRYAHKPQREAAVDDLLPGLAAPAECEPDGLTDERVAEVYQLMNNATCSMTPAEFRAWLAKDLPGLSEEQRGRFASMLVEYIEGREICRSVQNEPALDFSSAAIYRRIPKWIRDRVSRRFVATYVNADLDPETGQARGTARQGWADNVAWVDRMINVLGADIVAKTKAARAASDRVKPVKRPWVLGVNDP